MAGGFFSSNEGSIMQFLNKFLGKDFPGKSWLQDRNFDRTRTPDALRLTEQQFQLLFVADRMKVGFSQYSLISEHSAFVCLAFTQKDFNFYHRKLPFIDDLVPLPADPPSGFVPNAKIFGELHSVESLRLTELDNIKENGVQFIRTRVPLVVPYRQMILEDYQDEEGRPLPIALQGKRGVLSPQRVHLVKAWMYVGNPDYWTPMLDGGFDFQSVKLKFPYKEKRWLKKFYHFTEQKNE